MQKAVKVGEKLGLSKEAARTLAELHTPELVQDFVNKIPWNTEPDGDTARSVSEVLRLRQAHCVEGAFVGACALWMAGRQPLLMDMGASEADLRSIFFKNGLLIVATGWLSGLVVGLGIIALQHYVGIVPLGTGYVQEYYPVSLKWEHIALTSAIVLGIGSSLSAWATRRVIK